MNLVHICHKSSQFSQNARRVSSTATTYCNAEISLQKFTSPASPASPQSSVLTNGWCNAEPGDIRMGYHDESLESLQQCVAVISSVAV